MVLDGAYAPPGLPERLRTKALGISRQSLAVESSLDDRSKKIVPPTIDTAETATMILLCEHPAAAGVVGKWETFFRFPLFHYPRGMRERPINPAV